MLSISPPITGNVYTLAVNQAPKAIYTIKSSELLQCKHETCKEWSGRKEPLEKIWIARPSLPCEHRSIRLFKPRLSALLVASTNELVRATEVCTELRSSNNVQGGGDRRRRHGRRGRGEGAVLGPAAGASAGYERADPLVPVPRGHRRVRGHAHLPLRQPRHRHRLQEPVRRPGLHRRRLPRRRLGLRRHHLRPRLLHRRRLRWPHQPGGDVRAVRGEEAVAGAHGAVHRGAVPRRHLRRGHGEGHRGGQLRDPRRRRKHGGRRRLGRGGARRGDRRHVRAGVHRPLRHRPQAHRARLLHPRAGAAAHRLRRVHRAPGHHTHHRHRHQPGPEPRRRRHVQPAQGMEGPLDILGGAAPRRDGGCVVPPVRAARRGRQGAGLVQEHRRRHRTNLIIYTTCNRSKLVDAYPGSNLAG